MKFWTMSIKGNRIATAPAKQVKTMFDPIHPAWPKKVKKKKKKKLLVNQRNEVKSNRNKSNLKQIR